VQNRTRRLYNRTSRDALLSDRELLP
jgi:hypothetical protein